MRHISITVNKGNDMIESVTGTDSIVGFTHGHGCRGDTGLSGKDASFLTSQFNQGAVTEANHASTLNSNFLHAQQDRFDHAILHEISRGHSDLAIAIEKNGAANSLATEKIGAATSLAVEKVGAANQLAVREASTANLLATERSAASIQLEALRNAKDVLAAMAACCCEIKEGQAATNALILSTDANRIRDDLREARAELLAHKVSCCPGGNGNNN